MFRPVVPERANLNINWCACRRFSSHRLHSRCHRHCVPLLTHGYMSNQHSLLSLLRSRMSSKGKRIYVNSRPRAVGIRRLCAMYGIGTISACPVLVWVRPTSHIPQPLRMSPCTTIYAVGVDIQCILHRLCIYTCHAYWPHNPRRAASHAAHGGASEAR